MIVYRCDRCGQRIGERIRVTASAGGREEHFCSIDCAVKWGEWSGYYRPPADDVVDAEIICGATAPISLEHPGLSGAGCKFPDGHPGDHVSYRGDIWAVEVDHV